MSAHDQSTQHALDRLLREHRLFPETPLYREAMLDTLTPMKMTKTSRAAASGNNVEVEIRLGDILKQGGLVHPVESVTVERAWYCTLPAGSIEVREVG